MKITETVAIIIAISCCLIGVMSVVIVIVMEIMEIIPYKSERIKRLYKVCSYIAMLLGIYIYGSFFIINHMGNI